MSKVRPCLMMIGNSHIDPVWLWTEEEGFQEVKATFASALERMKEFPEFQFTASSAALYDWVRKHHPKVFAQIKKRVEQGRWHVAGGWWVEPDVNLSSGESLVRHGLYGQRFFQKHFKKTAKVAFNVDSFGHSAGIPGILAGQGIKGYVFMRPQPWQLDLPGELFKWADQGGQAVIACRTSGEYCAWTKTAIMSNLNLAMETINKQDVPCLPVYYGVGNHGGGPTIENIKAVREIKEEFSDYDIRNGSLEDCLSAWENLDLPVLEGEMQGCFRGCFSADSQIKTLNRQAESALMSAETLSALAMPLGFSYPEKKLRKAWKRLLFQQFHDTLAGTARKEARDEAVMHLKACLITARTVQRNAVQALAAAIDTRGDGYPLLLFNPNSRDYQGIIEADIYWRSKFPLRLKDSSGNEIPYDYTARNLVAPDARKRLVFYGNVPAFGYAVYRLMPETPVLVPERMDCTNDLLQNKALALRFDSSLGLHSILSNDSGAELLASHLELVVYEDLRDTWGAQGPFGKRLGAYELTGSALEEQGSVRSALHLRYTYEHSVASLTFELGNQDEHFTIQGGLMNQQRFAMTVLRIPLAFKPESCVVETPYAQLERAIVPSQEEVCQRYLEVRGKNQVLFLVNLAKYAYRIHEGALEIILSRSPVHAFSSGEDVKDGQSYAYSDQGEIPFCLQIYPRPEGLSQMDRIHKADALHRPVHLLASDSHTGQFTARSKSLAQAEGILVHQLKKGEDGGIIARVQNPSNTEVKGQVSFYEQSAEVTLAPHALVALHFTKEGGIHLTDLLESPQPDTTSQNDNI